MAGAITDRLCAMTSRRPSVRWKPPVVVAGVVPGVAAASVAIAATLLRRAVHVGRARVTVTGAARRDVEPRVAVEEPDRLEREPGVVDRHDRPVLGPREVGGAERVPHDDVLAVDVA